ncbi:MAG: ParB-like protein [Steroidobacteraceae bacterium]
MTFSREPRIHCVPIMALRPTQITVGMREVKAKRKSWREHPDRKKADFLGNHLIPVIWGPKDEYYVIDHHHLTLALHQEGVKEIATTVVADLRRLPREAFWVFLDNRGWLHPFDEHGRRRSYDDLPKRIPALVDDPYRSLAGELRNSGGCSKETTPFSEFLWADYLRRRLKRKLLDEDFSAALLRALKLAKSDDADFLPGWCGPIA